MRLVLPLLLVGSAYAWAGPPFVTNDPDLPELGQWKINRPWSMERSRDDSASGEWVPVDVNYGYDRYTQLSIEMSMPYKFPAGGGLHFDASDVLL